MSEAYELTYETQTDLAVGVRYNGETVWLPKSQIEYDEDANYRKGDMIDVIVPDWLAKKYDYFK